MTGRAGKSHLSSASQTVVWLTPRGILNHLGDFDLDPCAAPPPQPWPTAKAMVALPDDGLSLEWWGRVWLNPPWGTVPLRQWMPRMARHGRGIAFIPVATETQYWREAIWPHAHALRFTGPGRVHFHRPGGRDPGRCGEEGPGWPGHEWRPFYPANPKSALWCINCGVSERSCGASTALVAYGADDADILAACGISGEFVALVLPRGVLVTAIDVTWAEAVREVFRRRQGAVRLDDLYMALAESPKARRNRNWRAKVRQTVQREEYQRVGRGVWAERTQGVAA